MIKSKQKLLLVRLHITGQGRSYRGATGVVAPKQKHFFKTHLNESRSYEVSMLYLLDN